MNLQEYRHLQSERTALERLIAQVPKVNVIEHMGLEARKGEIEESLASQTAPLREPVRARLTFGGKPILGSYGVSARFAAVAVETFVKAVAAIGASLSGSLTSNITSRHFEDCPLLITGTALGSFGFELEEAARDNELDFPETSLVGSAIGQAEAIMEASTKSDEELAEAISECDPPALRALREFLETLAREDAICSLEFGERRFRFPDVGAVRQSQERLSGDNIHDETLSIAGMFQGVLPKRRTFEFRVAQTQEIIVGKVGTCIPDAAIINRVLDQPRAIEVLATRVGAGRPRYVLQSIEELTNHADQASRG